MTTNPHNLPARLVGMTQAKWDGLSEAQRRAMVDESRLSPQLMDLRGWRVEVIRDDGSKARFIVGKSTGWRPCHLELKSTRSAGGDPADKRYRHVKALEKVRG